jgi:hypothetical protein
MNTLAPCLLNETSIQIHLRPLSDKGKPVARLGRKATGQVKT